jgi:hypothetical protein
MKQMISGDRHGNLVLAPQRKEELDAAGLVSGDAQDNYQWLDGENFFHIKLEKPGKLTVILIGEKSEHLAGNDMSALMPFHEGWNEDRIWKVVSSADNVIDGLIFAGR